MSEQMKNILSSGLDAAVILLIGLLVMILNAMHVQTASLIAVLGSCGVAIALALKDSLGNVAGGFVILMTHPFKQGDYVDIEGTQGLVQHIDLLLTTLTTYDNKVITIPNGKVVTSVLTNYSREESRRIDLLLRITYETEIEKARTLLLALADDHPLIRKEPPPLVVVSSRDENAIELTFRVWTATEHFWMVKEELEETVTVALKEDGIEIPHRQMDIHMKYQASKQSTLGEG